MTTEKETKQIDLLFLELSQFTNAKTGRELRLEYILVQVLNSWKEEANLGDGIHERHKIVFDRAWNILKDA